MLQAGDCAPDFELLDQNGQKVRLSDFRSRKSVVLYFYPKDDTPGCTREACTFRDHIGVFSSAGVEVLGVSLDGVASHQIFAEKYGLNFKLLSDAKREVARAYGVLGRFLGLLPYAKRVTFVIDKQGTIRKVFPKVPTHGEGMTRHQQELLGVLAEMERPA